jgi:hypothetical protein
MRIDEILDSGENIQPAPVQESYGSWLISAGNKLSKWGAKQTNAAKLAADVNKPALDILAKLEAKRARPPIIKPRIKLKTPTKTSDTPDEIIIQQLNQRVNDLEAKRISARLAKLVKKDRDFGDTLIKIGAGGTGLIAVNKYLEYLDSKENNDQ